MAELLYLLVSILIAFPPLSLTTFGCVPRFELCFRHEAFANALQLLTSAWMKMNPLIYADFLEGVDVITYVLQNIEPAQIELDHLGLQGLATSVINAAGIAIEVLYLDRSEGAEVNTHRLPVLDGGGNPVAGAPVIRLLYRPYVYSLEWW